MDSDWSKLTLKQAGVSLIDCDHRTPAEATSGYPYVSIPQLRDGRITIKDARRISPEDFVEWTRKANPQANDVVLSRRCNPGESAYVPDGVQFALGQNLVLLRSDGTRLYPPFLRWLMRGPEWWRQVETYINVGAVFTSLKCADIPKFELMIPPIDVQRRIADALRVLDNKIDLTRRINQTLEAMAQAIFKSWFVDFDPVKAKIAAIEQGQEPLRAAMRAISGKTDAELDQMPREHHDQLAATAALFPDAMEESELGEIPKGWNALSFGDVAQQGKGAVNPGTSPKASFTHYSLPAFDASQLPIVESGESIKSNKTPVPDNAVLVSKLNPHIPRIWLVGRAGERAVCSTEFIVWSPKLPANSAFVYGLSSLPEFNTAMRQLVTGTSNSHQRVKPEQLADICVFAADDEAIARYSATVAPLMEKMLRNREEARTLAELRDTLLPKLLSGELSVSSLKDRATA